MRRRRADEASDREIADLAALADGSLAPEQRVALEARVAESSELADRLAEQQRAIALTRSAAEGVEAPAALRARIEAQRRSRRGRAPRRLVLAGAATTAALVAAVAVAVSMLGPGTSAERLPRCPCTDRPGARSHRRGDAHQDHLGLADRARRLRASPPRRGKCFYEAWLRNAAGVLVPVGTFNEGMRVTLWAGVSPKDFTHADHHARAGRRRSDLVGTRRCLAGRSTPGVDQECSASSRAAVDSAHHLLASAVEAAHHRSLADA